MNKYFLIFLTTLTLVSCYTYKTYEKPEVIEIVEDTSNKREAIRSKRLNIDKKEVVLGDTNSNSKTKNLDRFNSQQATNTKSENKIVQVDAVDATPKTIIQSKGYYQMSVFDKLYKMEAVKWEGDTIVGFVKGKPNQVLKFHEKDIQNLKVRQFSKARSDAFTVASYATLGVGIFLLLK